MDCPKAMMILAIILSMKTAFGNPSIGCACASPTPLSVVFDGTTYYYHGFCYDFGCSANNTDCNYDTIFSYNANATNGGSDTYPDYTYNPNDVIYSITGCNCPGYSDASNFPTNGYVSANYTYYDYTYPDGDSITVAGQSSYIAYNYATCAEFGNGALLYNLSPAYVASATACCNYCCGIKVAD